MHCDATNESCENGFLKYKSIPFICRAEEKEERHHFLHTPQKIRTFLHNRHRPLLPWSENQEIFALSSSSSFVNSFKCSRTKETMRLSRLVIFWAFLFIISFNESEATFEFISNMFNSIRDRLTPVNPRDTSDGRFSKFNGPVKGLPAGHGGGQFGAADCLLCPEGQ